MSANTKCSKCANECPDNDKIICDMCHLPIHINCAGISKAEKGCLQSKNRKINFFCDKCDILSIIAHLKGEIDTLKADMNELKNTNNNDPGQVKTDLSQLDLINELEDRQRRSNNLILNIPESDKETSILRRDDDLTRCKEILTHNIQGDVTYEIMSCYRLGKFVVNKSRPLKITLATQSQALEVLKKYKQTDGHYLNRDLTPYQRNVCYLP